MNSDLVKKKPFKMNLNEQEITVIVYFHHQFTYLKQPSVQFHVM